MAALEAFKEEGVGTFDNQISEIQRERENQLRAYLAKIYNPKYEEEMRGY